MDLNRDGRGPSGGTSSKSQRDRGVQQDQALKRQAGFAQPALGGHAAGRNPAYTRSWGRSRAAAEHRAITSGMPPIDSSHANAGGYSSNVRAVVVSPGYARCGPPRAAGPAYGARPAAPARNETARCHSSTMPNTARRRVITGWEPPPGNDARATGGA